MEKPAAVRVVACGGTFDKRYDPLTGELVFAGSQLPAIVERVRLAIPVELETLMQLDSLDMTPADRERVVEACRRCTERAIVVVHGTDTMPDTARALVPHFGVGSAKTIVLTGAMVPYAFGQSDALFNLGFAFAAAQTAGAGVWIAMNGRVFAGDAVRKDRQAGRFESIDQPDEEEHR